MVKTDETALLARTLQLFAGFHRVGDDAELLTELMQAVTTIHRLG